MTKATFLIIIGLAFVLTGCTSIDQQSSDANQEQDSGISTTQSDTWKEVNHTNFWGHPDLFATPDYKFASIKFSYPDNWKFNCCNDMGHGSSHIIFSSQNQDASLPYIRIMDHALSGCPDVSKSCGLDQTVNKTPSEKFDDLTQTIPDNAQILPRLSLSNLDTDAFVYTTIDKDGKSVKSFIINTTDDVVVEISFVNYELLEEGFIDSFLEKIEQD